MNRFGSEEIAVANPANRLRTAIFIDYWNLETHLLHDALKSPVHPELDWGRFSEALCNRVESQINGYERKVICDYEETRVYAAPKAGRSRAWFQEAIGLAPRHTLILKERDTERIRCPNCGAAGHVCEKCEKPLKLEVEKGVDAALVTDLLWLAFQDLYDLAIVVSSDADLIAGIERTQLTGRKVVNARFPEIGDAVAAASWIAHDLDWMLEPLPMADQIWDVVGWANSAWRDAGIDDANDRLLRGADPLDLIAEARERSGDVGEGKLNWFLGELDRLEAAARASS